MPHLLVSGRTGCGKSVFINCVLESLKAKLSSTECKFIIIDTKGVDFDSWDGEKHLMCPVVRLDIDEASQKLQEVLQIMDAWLEDYIYDETEGHIHHITNDGYDNRPENLILVSATEHKKIYSGNYGKEDNEYEPGKYDKK